MVIAKNDQTPFQLEIDRSKELRQKSPLDINGLIRAFVVRQYKYSTVFF